MTETESETKIEPPAAPAIPLRYGTFYNRMVATVIDLGILFMIALPLVDIIMAHYFPPVDISHFIEVVGAPGVANNPPKLIAAFWQVMKEQNTVERLLVENLLEIVFLALYILPFWFRFSATPGKMLFRMEIRDATTDAPMTRTQAVVRFLGYIVSALPLTLGFVWASVNKRRRAFHDLIAGTVVVVRPKSADEE